MRAVGISSRTCWNPHRLNGGSCQFASVTRPPGAGGDPSIRPSSAAVAGGWASTGGRYRAAAPLPPATCAGSALDVEPGPSRPVVAEALAPDRDRLPGARHGGLAVVAVDLVEAVRVDVSGRPGRSVIELRGSRPRPPAVGGAAIPDIPRVGIVAAGGLHVPDPHVAPSGGCQARAGRVLAGRRQRGRVAP